MKWFNDIILFPEPNEDNPTNYSVRNIVFSQKQYGHYLESYLSKILCK